jgi:uncharacterized protein YukE
VAVVNYSADLSLADSVVSSLASVDGSLDDVLHDLRWRVARLHETFSGESAEAHVLRHARFEASYAEMQEALVAMRRAIRHAQRSYAAAARANVALWESVT